MKEEESQEQETKAHVAVKEFPKASDCKAFGKGCPFKAANDAHVSVMTPDSIAMAKEKCPAFVVSDLIMP